MPNLQPSEFGFMQIGVGTSDRVTIDAAHYRFSREYDGQVILRTLDEDPIFVTFTLREFYERHEKGEIKIEEGFFSEKKKVYAPNPGFTFRSYPVQKRAKAHFYAEMIKAYERLVMTIGDVPRSVDHLKPHMETLALEALNITRALMHEDTVKFFAPRSVGQFNKMYRKFMDSGRKVEALIDGDNGPGVIEANIVDPESLAVWRAQAEGYADSRQPSQEDKWEDLKAELHAVNGVRKNAGLPALRTPSFKVFRKHIKKISAYHVYYKRKSKAEADRKFGLSNGGFGMFKPGERVDIDEKRVDLMALLEYAHIWETLSDDEKNEVSRIRLWVVVAIDLATRYILAMRFCTAPNARTTIDVIRMMMEDKTELSDTVGAYTPWIGKTRPRMIYTDNGSGLVNEEVADILVECQIDHTRPTAGQPQARGHVESSFRTHQRVVRHFHGRTFRDVVEKGKSNPVNLASLTAEELERHYARALLDIYHNTPHEGLGGETPHNAWVRETRIHKMRPFIEPDIVRHIFGMEFTRRLDGDGLTFLGIPYNSGDLGKLLVESGQIDMKIRVDIKNLDDISYQKDDGLWYIAKNTIDLQSGISLPEWMQMWALVDEKFAKTTKLTLENFYAALRELRESGDAAALRNPLGVREVDRATVEKHERAIVHRAGFTAVRPASAPTSPGEAPVDAPVRRKSKFIGNRAAAFSNDIENLKEQAAAEVAGRKASKPKVATAKPRLSVEPTSADDIEF
jgi:putative transposase